MRRAARVAFLGILATGWTVGLPSAQAGAPAEVSIFVASWRYWITTDESTTRERIWFAIDVINTSPYRVGGYATARFQYTMGSGYVENAVIVGNLSPANLAPGLHGSTLTSYLAPGGSNIQSVTVTGVTAGGYTQPAPFGAVGMSTTGPIAYSPKLDEMAVPIVIRNRRSTPVTVWKVSAAFFAADGTILTVGSSDVDAVIAPFDEWTIWIYAEAPGIPVSVRLGMTSSPAGQIVTWDNWFHDIGTSTFQNDIAWIAEAGITRGCEAFRYCPIAGVTRAQMASFLVRAFTPTAIISDHFTDDETSTHEADINWLASAGWTTGCGGGKYCPDAGVTRAQMASFLVRALEIPPTAADFFTDDEASTHEADINRLAAAGLTSGCGGGKYCPTAGVTRGQMAAFLRRALE